MVAARLFQVVEIGDDRSPLAAEGEIDEVLQAAYAHLTGHGLKLRRLSLVKTVQPLCQIVQLAHIDQRAL